MDLKNWLGEWFLKEEGDLPFSLIYGGKPLSEWLGEMHRQVRSAELDEARTGHSIIGDEPQTGLRIGCDLIEYRDFPAVEWVLKFKNTSSKDTPILENIRVLDTILARCDKGEFVLHHVQGCDSLKNDYSPFLMVLSHHVVKTITSVGGRSSNAADGEEKIDGSFPFFNLEFDEGGIIFAVGWTGQWSARFKRDNQTNLRISAGMERTCLKLLPGEEIRSPRILMFTWSGDRIEGHNQFRQFLLKHHTPHMEGLPVVCPLASNTWFLYNGNGVTQENQIEAIRKISEAKIDQDCYWLDAGWYEGQGNWMLDAGNWFPKKRAFPDGLKPVTEEARKHGMGFVLWFEPERVYPGTWLHQHHPDWLLMADEHSERFRKQWLPEAEWLLNLGNPEARRWLTDHISAMVGDLGLTVYRHDFNIDPIGYWRLADPADRQGITEIRYIEGLYAFYDELRRRHPRLLIDNCASGGRRLDLEMLSRSVPLWRDDYCFEPEGVQCHTLGLSLYVPLSGVGFNSADRYIFRSNLAPGMSFCWTKEDVSLDELRARCEEFKMLRPLWSGDFYPLTCHSTAADAWCVWQLNRRDEGRGAVVALRRKESPFPSARLKLRGLDAEGIYELIDLDAGKKSRAAGTELMQTGLEIFLPDQPGSAIITYSIITKP
jgi:alpha-galactosidase